MRRKLKKAPAYAGASPTGRNHGGGRGGLGNPARFPVRHHSCKSDAKSGNQAVTATFGDQKLHIAGIGFDLLTQAVDMGFQRMRGDPRIIPPNLV